MAPRMPERQLTTDDVHRRLRGACQMAVDLERLPAKIPSRKQPIKWLRGRGDRLRRASAASIFPSCACTTRPRRCPYERLGCRIRRRTARTRSATSRWFSLRASPRCGICLVLCGLALSPPRMCVSFCQRPPRRRSPRCPRGTGPQRPTFEDRNQTRSGVGERQPIVARRLCEDPR